MLKSSSRITLKARQQIRWKHIFSRSGPERPNVIESGCGLNHPCLKHVGAVDVSPWCNLDSRRENSFLMDQIHSESPSNSTPKPMHIDDQGRIYAHSQSSCETSSYASDNERAQNIQQGFKRLSQIEKDPQGAIRYLSLALSEELQRHLEKQGGNRKWSSHNKNNFRKECRSTKPNKMHVRSFSTTSSDDKKDDSHASKNEEVEEREPVVSDAGVDKDFTDYLTGKMDNSGVPSINLAVNRLQSQKEQKPMKPTTATTTNEASNIDSDESSEVEKVKQKKSHSKSQQSTDEWFNRLLSDRKDLGRPKPGLNETYRDIERASERNIERTRSQQVKNVRRALGGNVLIAASKLAAFLHSGSSAMLSEFIHSVVDCGNQSLLLLGLRDAGNEADRTHQYGYGKSIYFWALVSALGTFFLGAGVSMTQSIPDLIYGHSLEEITWHVWAVLGASFVIDGYVFTKTLMEVNETKPEGISLWKHVWGLRDPATLAILLEDGAACLGVLMAIGGIGATQYYQMPVFDALAGVGISGLLASMGLILVRVNHRFLLGQSVDKDIREGIQKILMDRRSIDNVHSIQSQWTGPETFSFKAEVDFDGTFLAAKLMPRYQQEFAQARATLDQDLRVLLSWYAEDVMRTVEREVRDIEAKIRRKYPGAQFIELEPMSKDADRFAIDDGLEASLKRIEIEALNRYLRSLYQPTPDVNTSPFKNDPGKVTEVTETNPDNGTNKP